MTKQEEARLSLIAAILDSQVESVSPKAITEARLVEALTIGPGFTPDERQLLWLSPAARNTYFAVKARIMHDLEERLAAEQIGLELFTQVAGGDAELLIVDGEDFTVSVQNHLEDAGIWVIGLRLKEHARRLIPPMATLLLVDSGGLEWLSGRPLHFGEINAQWRHTDISPRDRLALHSLAIVLG